MIEPNFASLVLGIAVAEGLGRSLDPYADIIRISLPILLRARLKLLYKEGGADAFATESEREGWERLVSLECMM